MKTSEFGDVKLEDDLKAAKVENDWDDIVKTEIALISSLEAKKDSSKDDLDGGYLVQPIARPNGQATKSDFNAGNEAGKDDKNRPNSSTKRRKDECDLDDDDDEDDTVEELRPLKRR